jgi:RNA polymerase sigma-70 factor (ECF subfamily)
MLFRLCRDTAEAEDMFQEAFLRAFRSGGSFDPTRRFKTWLFAIAVNLARDRARRLAHPATPRVQDDGDLPEPKQTEPAEDQWIRRADLVSALDHLPEPIREVVLLRYFQGMEQAEIAAVVGIPQGTVKSRLHRGIRMLRDRLKGS